MEIFDEGKVDMAIQKHTGGAVTFRLDPKGSSIAYLVSLISLPRHYGRLALEIALSELLLMGIRGEIIKRNRALIIMDLENFGH